MSVGCCLDPTHHRNHFERAQKSFLGRETPQQLDERSMGFEAGVG